MPHCHTVGGSSQWHNKILGTYDRDRGAAPLPAVSSAVRLNSTDDATSYVEPQRLNVVSDLTGKGGRAPTVKCRAEHDQDASTNDDGLTLEYAPDELRADPVCMLAAVRADGLALKYAFK